jgi:hypothetical protein
VTTAGAALSAATRPVRGIHLLVVTLVSSSALGCSSGLNEPPALTPRSAHPKLERPAWPTAAREADSAQEVVLLEAPRAHSLARDVIWGFFDAVRRESVRDLGTFVSDEATISSGPGSAPEPVGKVWAARFRRLDYGFSGAKDPYRQDELGLFTSNEITRLGAARRFELEPAPGELLAVVTTRDRRRLSGPRHFGRRIEFVLGQTAAGLRITRMFEDFRMP